MRVLIVEDDPDLARQLKAALGDAGYAVDHAPDGEEAHFLGETELSPEAAEDTLGAVVKERDDLDLVRENLEEITSSG